MPASELNKKDFHIYFALVKLQLLLFANDKAYRIISSMKFTNEFEGKKYS